MSHHGLQRALVVALHDPAFVAAMHAAPEQTLAPFGLDEREQAQLLAVDRRAFAVDRLRSRRVLKAIVEELEGSMAIALAEARSLSFAEEFFSSAEFHAAIREDRPLVLALADYLAAALASGRIAAPVLRGVLAIERARAECRRDAGREPPPGLSPAAGLRLCATDAGALAALHAAERHIFELRLLPHVALCDDRPALELPPPEPARPLYLAVRLAGGDPTLDELTEPLFRSLEAIATAAARGRVEREDVAAILASIGLRVPDPGAFADALVADGYLTAR